MVSIFQSLPFFLDHLTESFTESKQLHQGRWSNRPVFGALPAWIRGGPGWRSSPPGGHEINEGRARNGQNSETMVVINVISCIYIYRLYNVVYQ
jgi:hypothetical protein